MVALMIRPAALDLTETDKANIYGLLRNWGAMTANEVASTLKLDDIEVALYLANEAGLENLGYANGWYVTRD